MTDRPIIFSGPMVRALLDGHKTMTRRLAWIRCKLCGGTGGTCRGPHRPSLWQKVKPGDRLWVRENFWIAVEGPQYAADQDKPSGTRVTPCIHMPRHLSRITLIVSGTKTEPVQSISEDDAKAEGVERDTEPCDHTRQSCEDVGCLGPTFKSSFCLLWMSLHGHESWKSNPDVVALSFSVHRQNIDAMPKEWAA